MKIHSTNYFDTFIQIADDCPADTGETPPVKNESKSIATIQFELIRKYPYKYTSDDILFHVFAERNDIVTADLKIEREKFYSKGQPCFRASPLTKRYGWGVHYNKEGKMAIYGCESKEYEKFSKDKTLKILKAMKSAR